MIDKDLLTNKPLDGDFLDRANAVVPESEKILFALVGDLDLKGRYGLCRLLVSRDNVYAFDKYHEGGMLKFAIADCGDCTVKRMYGNAILRLREKGVNGEVSAEEAAENEDPDRDLGPSHELIRFTYCTADLADAAALFIKEVGRGRDWTEQFDIVRASYEKMRSFCPKCGRRLSSPGAECLHCASKKTLVKKISKYVSPEKKTLLLSLLLSVFTTAMALAPPYMTKMLVDDVLPNRDNGKLLFIVLFLLGIYLVQYALGACRGHLMRVAGDRTVARLRDDIYEKAQFLPMSFYDKTSVGSVISRVSGDTNTLQAFILRITQDAVVQLFTMLGIIVIMFVLNWKLTLLSLIPIPLVVLGARYFGKKIQPIYRRIWKRSAAVNSLISDTLPGVRVIKSFTSERRATDKFVGYDKEWLNEDVKASLLVNIFPNVVTFFVTCGSLLIWGIGGRMVIGGTSGVSAGLLVSFISYAAMFYGPVNFFATLNDSYQNALTSAQKIFEIIDAEPESNFGGGKELKRLSGRIEFRNVNFSYDKTKKTLNNINLVIEPGDIVGIVGTTGSGKSTLISLLLRFYDNYEGEILVDGQNIKDIDLYHYRSQIGYVQQEPMMFRDTIFNNIAYSDPDASVEEVIHAADVANAHCFIARLPDAYDTMLGERGVGLSGGERQRLSIARAVLKNPSMLVFDEATASVDSETEHLIQEAIERLISGRTTLMIAHRLSTLSQANKIVVVDKGEIIEFGSPDELMRLKGKYYKLVQIQSMADQVARSKEEENFE